MKEKQICALKNEWFPWNTKYYDQVLVQHILTLHRISPCLCQFKHLRLYNISLSMQYILSCLISLKSTDTSLSLQFHEQNGLYIIDDTVYYCQRMRVTKPVSASGKLLSQAFGQTSAASTVSKKQWKSLPHLSSNRRVCPSDKEMIPQSADERLPSYQVFATSNLDKSRSNKPGTCRTLSSWDSTILVLALKQDLIICMPPDRVPPILSQVTKHSSKRKTKKNPRGSTWIYSE